MLPESTTRRTLIRGTSDRWLEYWVADGEVASRLDERWQRGWLLGWRDICRSTDRRTVIASLIPRVAVRRHDSH
jgi:hypothetical protein